MTDHSSEPQTHPERIGPYKLLQLLGEGGMGEVWLAEQSAPVHRRVALKIIKLGMDTKQFLARLEVERQALAVMDHPNIARFLDGGAAETGRPYFVMELIQGVPITEYCDKNRLSTDERIRLFIDVCQAVQHAHHKGVVHRDLKPSNVLVTVKDNRPVAKIIDFGIAKALGHELTDLTLVTRMGQMVGTPEYMSPEQAEMSGLDVDTRTDVYSLGVMLYELLVGARPFDLRARLDEVIRYFILATEVPKPSARLTSMGETQDTVAELRRTTVDALKKELKTDLDWVILKAMEKDRTRRYETASALAQELERHLRHEPVEARAPSATYRMGKFIRRHRAGVVFAASFGILLTLSTVGATIQAGRIAQARDEAAVRRDQAEGLIDFMLGDLRGKLAPIGRLEVLEDVDDQALKYFASIPESEFTDEELVLRSQSLYQIGSVRNEKGDAEGAEEAYRESLRLSQALVDRDPQNVAWLRAARLSQFYVGYASFQKGDLDSAEEWFRKNLELGERQLELLADQGTRSDLSSSYSNLGSVLEAKGDLEGAVEAYARCLALEEEQFRRDTLRTDVLGEISESHNHLAVAHQRLGAYDQALAHFIEERELKNRLISMDPRHAYWRYRLGISFYFLAGLRWKMGQQEMAIEDQREGIRILDSLSAYDPSNAQWLRNAAVSRAGLGGMLAEIGRTSESLALLRGARPPLENLLRADSSGLGYRLALAQVNNKLARALLVAGRSAEALEIVDPAHLLLSTEGPSGRAGTVTKVESELVRGWALAASDREAEAQEAWLGALQAIETLLSGPGGAEFRPMQAEVLLALNRPEEARPVLLQLWERGYAEPYLNRLAAGRGIYR